MPEITLGRLAGELGLELVKGDPERKVRRLAGLDAAGPGDLSFHVDRSYDKLLAVSRAEAVIVGKGVDDAPPALLRADNPNLAFARAALLISPPPPSPPPGIHPSAVVAPSAKIGKDVSIGACAVIEAGAVVGDRTGIRAQVFVGAGSKIGADCQLHPGVRIYHDVTVGDRCILHGGAVIGADGFGYIWTGKDFFKIPQVGAVVVEDDVEIGANACVDRARFGETRIGRGTKIDNLAQIAHNVAIGPYCVFAAQVGISGSASVGTGVRMGGQAGVGDHLRIGDGVTLYAKSAVSKSIPGRESGVEGDRLAWAYIPARPVVEYLQEARHIKSLGKLRETVRKIEKAVDRLIDGNT